MPYYNNIKEENIDLLYHRESIRPFNSFLGVFTRNGKKVKAWNFLKGTFRRSAKKKEPIGNFRFVSKSFDNVYPQLYFRRLGRRRVFYLPRIINDDKRIKVLMSWIKISANERKKTKIKIGEKLSKDLVEAYYEKGNVVEKKNTMYNLLLEGRPFLYILKRWNLTKLEINELLKSLKRKEEHKREYGLRRGKYFK